MYKIIQMIIINLIYIAQFHTNGILTALYIVIKYIQTQCMHIWTYIKIMFIHIIHVYTDTCTNI